MPLSKIQDIGNQVIPNLGRRNLLINGAMKVAQRGTSFSTGSSTIYTLDRFQSATGSSFNFDLTLTQSTDTPTGFSNSLKVSPDSTQTPSGSQNGAIRYNIEAQDLQSLGYGSSDAKKITLSFYVKSNKTGTYSVQLIGYDGQNSCVATYTIDASNTWERKTITIDPDTSNAFANDNTLGILMAWHLACGPDDIVSPNTSWGVATTGFRAGTGQVNFMDSTSNEWYLTGVQLEVGDSASDFEHRSFAEELALCQRYFCGFTPETSTGVTHAGLMNLNNRTTTAKYSVVHFPVPMRIRPTVSYSGSLTAFSGGTSTGVTALSMNGSTGHSAEVEVTTSSNGTVGHGGWVRILANAYVHFDAEL